MANRQQLNAETTRQEILDAAKKLFSVKGYESVTIRQIAREAGCSHTTLYIYFKDKEALLHDLSLPPLLNLKQQMEQLLTQENSNPEQALKSLSLLFLRFCLENRNMYRIFFEAKAVRVDEQRPELEINKIRIELFDLLKDALKHCLQENIGDKQLLTSSRIFFFMLRGIVGTYTDSEEPLDLLFQRLLPTFNEAIEVLLIGLKQKTKQGVE